MNQISDDEIYSALRESIDYLKTIYNEAQLFGIAVFGYANYGIAESKDEIRLQAFYIPTIEEMLINQYFITNEIKYKDYLIQVKDLRSVYNATIFQDIEMIESVYTPYYIVNPRYSFIFDTYFRNKADQITYPAKQERLRLAATKALEELHKGNKKGFAYAYLFCKKYSQNNAKFNETWAIESEEDYQFIKDYVNGRVSFNTVQEAVLYMTDLSTVNSSEEIPENNDLKAAIVSIYTHSLNTINTSFAFEKSLTDAERLALKSLVEEISDSGILSISNFVKSSGCSKAVILKLLEKLRKYNIAIVQSLGSRGTHIQFIDSIVFDI